MSDLFENPLGTNGFEFIEYTGDPVQLDQMFQDFGFTKVAQHKKCDISLYRQGQINFLLNAEAGGQAAAFREAHTAGANAMAFRVENAKSAYEEAIKRGAGAAEGQYSDIPVIKGVGGTLIYLIDTDSVYDEMFDFIDGSESVEGFGLTYIDHVTHNLYRGNMDVLAKFYEDIFNFREIRYFDIEGKLTGLRSRAMTSPCGKIRIPLNESSDDKSQIEEFLQRFNGEGIQHIALGTDDIFATVAKMKSSNVVFLDTPDSYYDKLDERVPGHDENLDDLRRDRILLDGAPTEGQGILLQIFTQDEIGPVFFEVIQRKGNEGFGEGNFQALFESIEQDQVRRGVLDDDQIATG